MSRIENLLRQYETGSLSRRQVECLALALSALVAGGTTSAAASSKVSRIDHIAVN